MSAIQKAISKEELARHYRRRTRGAEVTLQLIEELVLELSSSPTAVDSNGVHVFSGDMVKILNEEKKHIKCIQDPDGIRLYTVRDTSSRVGWSCLCSDVHGEPPPLNLSTSTWQGKQINRLAYHYLLC